MKDYNEDLREYYNNCGVDKLQDIPKRAITNVVENKENTMCIMNSGIERALVYMLSAKELGGTCIVISPMFSIAYQQAEIIRNNGYKVIQFINDDIDDYQMDYLIKFANNEKNPDFIFIKPERLATDGFLEYCINKRRNDISLFVIDEAQSVIQWGGSFRPFYKNIPDFLNRIFGDKNNWCRILTLSEALNADEYDVLCSIFNIDNNTGVIKDDILIHSQIQLHAEKFDNKKDKLTTFWKITEMHSDEKILVYMYNKEGIKELCNDEKCKPYNAACFHADMTSDERNEVIEKYRKGEINLLFTTYPYGMNIVIEDIRTVIHLSLPGSAGQYYQEVGCAGRDGKSANAYLLYTDNDIENGYKYFIDNKFPDKKMLIDTYEKIAEQTGYAALENFNDNNINKCLPYYISCKAAKIAEKGFTDFTFLENINDQDIQTYYDSTETKEYIEILKKNNLTPDKLSNSVYKAMVEEKVSFSEPPQSMIVLKVNKSELDDATVKNILDKIEKKKEFEHKLFNDFVKIITENKENKDLLPEIAKYLSEDKYQSNRIYTTLDDNIVRSKSEVIIADLLYEAGIDYTYDEELSFGDGTSAKPDFTIRHNNKIYYWEHLGMPSNERYRNRWLYKKKNYDEFYPGQLKVTYDSGVLPKEAQEIINEIKNDKSNEI